MSVKNPERNIWTAQHIMLDIETMGGDAMTSPILAIAAMKFDPLALVTNSPRGNVIDDAYYSMDYIDEPNIGIYYDTLNLIDQLKYAKKIDLPTLAWWTDSPEKSSILHRMLKRQTLLEENKIGLMVQLTMFSQWVNATTDKQYTYVWAYGNTFDMAFLEHAFRLHDVPFPFHYQGLMDARTLVQTFEIMTKTNFPFVQDTRSHHALADVVKQIGYVQQALAFLQ
jgi:hypothetical protein